MCTSTFMISRLNSDPGNQRRTLVSSLQASPTELDLRNIKIYTRSFKIYGIWPQASKQAQTRTCAMLSGSPQLSYYNSLVHSSVVDCSCPTLMAGTLTLPPDTSWEFHVMQLGCHTLPATKNLKLASPPHRFRWLSDSKAMAAIWCEVLTCGQQGLMHLGNCRSSERGVPEKIDPSSSLLL